MCKRSRWIFLLFFFSLSQKSKKVPTNKNVASILWAAWKKGDRREVKCWLNNKQTKFGKQVHLQQSCWTDAVLASVDGETERMSSTWQCRKLFGNKCHLNFFCWLPRRITCAIKSIFCHLYAGMRHEAYTVWCAIESGLQTLLFSTSVAYVLL